MNVKALLLPAVAAALAVAPLTARAAVASNVSKEIT